MIVDIENSDLSKGIIAFKPIEENKEDDVKLDYAYVAEKLFKNNKAYYYNGYKVEVDVSDLEGDVNDPHNCVSPEHAEHLMSYNRLLNVA